MILNEEKPCTALFPQRGCRNNTWPKSPECYECVAMKEWQMRQEAYRAQARHMAREVVAFSRDQRNPEMRVDQFVAKYGASDVWETGYVANDIEDWLRSKRLLEEGK